MRVATNLWACVTVVVAASSARAEVPDLLEAYKREYAFLEAERAELDKRLGRTRGESSAEIARAEAAVTELDRQTAALRVEANLLEEELARLERESGAAATKVDALPELIERAQASLGLEAAPTETTSEAITGLMEVTRTRLEMQRKLASEPGSFFLPDGSKIEGTVVRLGEVAAWGVSPGGSGALAPAGGGQLSLWNKPAGTTARALMGGPATTPALLEVLFWDKADKRMEPRKERDFAQYTSAGGEIAWVIVGVGALALLAVLVRAMMLAWFGIGGRLRRIRAEITRLVTPESPESGASVEPTLLEERINSVLLREAPRLDRLQTIITVLAAIAPLLGLLGTVTGMIATFDIITEYGNSDPKLLSGGISEALITTEYGLMVAIPILLMGTLLSARANILKTRLERIAVEILVAGLGPDSSNVKITPLNKRDAKSARAAPPMSAATTTTSKKSEASAPQATTLQGVTPEWMPSSNES
jgi:biopolymer transport protein ExbB